MATRGGVSPLVIKRLPRYYRFLENLSKKNINRISSGELAIRMGLTASQIRQDLNCFGGFGQQGFGYNVEELKNSIAGILGLNKSRKTVFDKKESLAGQIINDMPVRHTVGLENFCRDNKPTAAILCIPENEAEEISELLINLGIKGFWNFSHYDIAINHKDIAVENVHLSDSIMTLSYNLNEIE